MRFFSEIIHVYVCYTEKETNFAEIFKNLVKYQSKNNFFESSK